MEPYIPPPERGSLTAGAGLWEHALFLYLFLFNLQGPLSPPPAFLVAPKARCLLFSFSLQASDWERKNGRDRDLEPVDDNALKRRFRAVPPSRSRALRTSPGGRRPKTFST